MFAYVVPKQFTVYQNSVVTPPNNAATLAFDLNRGLCSYIEMALGSQSRGAGAIAENSAPWELKLGTEGA